MRRTVFQHEPCRSSKWQHSLIRNPSDERFLDKALDDLLGQSVNPSTHTPSLYLPLLKACIKLKALPQAQRINAHLSPSLPCLSTFLVENLLLALAKCGGLDDAMTLFHTLPCRTVFSWSAIISGFADYGFAHDALRMHQYMLEDGLEPDAYTWASLFKACGTISDLNTGKKLHGTARIQGFSSDMFVLTALLSMYAKCGALKEAFDIFSSLPQPDVVSWTAMLSAYVDHGEGEMALHLYRQMHEEGMYPSHQTMVIVLQACGIIAEKANAQSALDVGHALHAHARRKGFLSHVFVHTTLVSMYGKFGKVKEAEHIFTGQLQHHLTLWNAMLSAYVDQGYAEKVLQLFVQMHIVGISPDQRTYVITLQACGALLETDDDDSSKVRSTRGLCLEIAQALHNDAEARNFTSDVFVGTSLLSFYGKCGMIAKAESVFHELSQHTAVAWNAMVCVYVEGGQGEKVMAMYKQIQAKRVPLDATSLVCILQACNEVGSLDMCLQLHFVVVSMEHDSNLFLRSALIHTYGGSGSIKNAEVVFDQFPYLDAVSWNACMAGYTTEGNATSSMRLLEEISLAGFTPDGVTYASVISACNHAGLVHKAIEYFVFMSSVHGILPDSKHLVSITDLLGRAGDFMRVENIVQRMSKQADLTMWLFLLGACRTHGNVELAKQVFEYTVGLQPKQATAYISMSNIYAEAGDVPNSLEGD